MYLVTKSRSVTVKLESAEEDNKMKDYFSDVEVDVSKRIKNSTGMGRKENTTESTKSVSLWQTSLSISLEMLQD